MSAFLTSRTFIRNMVPCFSDSEWMIYMNCILCYVVHAVSVIYCILKGYEKITWCLIWNTLYALCSVFYLANFMHYNPHIFCVHPILGIILNVNYPIKYCFFLYYILSIPVHYRNFSLYIKPTLDILFCIETNLKLIAIMQLCNVYEGQISQRQF